MLPREVEALFQCTCVTGVIPEQFLLVLETIITSTGGKNTTRGGANLAEDKHCNHKATTFNYVLADLDLTNEICECQTDNIQHIKDK